MNSKIVKGWTELVSSWLTMVALLVGGIFGLVEYSHNNTAEQTKTALEFLDRYDRSPYLDAHQAIFDVWDSKDFSAALSSADAKGKIDVLIKSVADGKLERPLDRMFDFYDALYACTCGHACNGDAVLSIFQKRAKDLYWNGFPYLTDKRNRSHDLKVGDGLEQIARAKSLSQFLERCARP